ncbi:MAG TPA: MBL fold metallo-hydrolase, partial [Solirubrobacterales bacterium]|nr:MBL fold metallo-hydrolase [Solirubrobacterales bacterium]
MLNLGWMTAPAGFWRQGDVEPERPLRLPVPAYLVETESERILIDTGLHPDAVTDPEARYGQSSPLAFFGLEQEEGLTEQVDLGSLTRVVLTHLHFDHAGGLALIPASV